MLMTDRALSGTIALALTPGGRGGGGPGRGVGLGLTVAVAVDLAESGTGPCPGAGDGRRGKAACDDADEGNDVLGGFKLLLLLLRSFLPLVSCASGTKGMTASISACCLSRSPAILRLPGLLLTLLDPPGAWSCAMKLLRLLGDTGL